MRKILIISGFLYFGSMLAQPSGSDYCSNVKQRWWQTAAEYFQTGTPAHRARMHRYDVLFYHIRVTLDTTSAFVAGHTTIRAKAIQPIDSFAFELHPSMTIDILFLNGISPTSGAIHNSERDAVPAHPIGADSIFSVDIYYHGTAVEGLFNEVSPSWGNRITYSLTEPSEADGWFPCKQELDEKADSARIDVTVPLGCRAGSNGMLESVDTAGAWHTFRWKTNYPVAYYLLSVSVGQYVDYSFTAALNDGTSFPVVNYVYPSALGFFKDQIDTTAALLRLFSDRFGRYPFYQEKYGHCMAPFSGGMEHQTMTAQGFFNLMLTAHELMHQWFGDAVTCGRWNDLWINEGFASYGEVVAKAAFEGVAAARQRMAVWHSQIKSIPGGSVYVPDASIDDWGRLFDGRLTYHKGAAVVHMMRYRMGDSAFFDAMRAYVQTFSGRFATTDSLRHFLEARTGVSWQAFFDEWIYGEGYPIYTLEWNWRNDTLYCRLRQQTSHPSVTFYSLAVPVRYQTAAGIRDVRLQPSDTDEVFIIPEAEQVTDVRLDPDGWVLAEKTVVHRPDLTGMSAPGDFSSFSVALRADGRWTVTMGAPGTVRVTDVYGRVISMEDRGPGTFVLPMPERLRGVFLVEYIGRHGERLCRRVVF